LADIVNVVIGVILVPKFVDAHDLGAVLPLTQFSLLFAAPMGAVAKGGLRAVALHQARGEATATTEVVALMLRLAGLASLLFLLFAVLVWEGVGIRLDLSSSWVLILVAGTGVVACWRPVVAHLVQGLHQFHRYSLSVMIESGVRLSFCVVLLPLLHLMGYLSAFLAASACSLLFLLLGLKGWEHRSVSIGKCWGTLRRLWPGIWPLLIFYGVLAMQGLVEPWVVRQRLPVSESAGYYVLFKFAAIPTYVSAALTPFFLSIATSQVGKGKSTKRMNRFAVGCTFSVGFIATLGAWFFGGILLDLYSAWRPYVGFACYLAPLTLAMALHAVVLLHVAHEIAMGRYRFSVLLSIPIMFEIVALYALTGWEFFSAWLPGNVCSWFECFEPRRMAVVVGIMVIVRVVCVMLSAVDVFFRAWAGRARR